MYGIGVAVADYDNDGRDDIYITALEGDRLFHNEGQRQVPRRDAKRPAFSNANFGTSAAWLDYDKDGKADLFVANYVQWTQKGDLWCSLDGATKSYCTPESYKGTSSRLFQNLGGGKFEDVTQKAGLGDPPVSLWDRGARLQQRWLARPLRRERHATEQAISQQRQWNVQEEGVSGRRRFRRRRCGARSDGRRFRRLRSLRPPSSACRQFLESDARACITTKATDFLSMKRLAPTVGRSSLLTLAFGVFFFDYDLDG